MRKLKRVRQRKSKRIGNKGEEKKDKWKEYREKQKLEGGREPSETAGEVNREKKKTEKSKKEKSKEKI